MFEPLVATNEPVIKVIGVGGGGGNAVEYMVLEHIEGVEFFVVNTDAQALRKSQVNDTIQIGSNVTKGLGAGANPEVGRTSAEEDRETIRAALEGADMVFIAAGMGGGTGTGAAPVVAEIAKELGILTVAVVTKPFGFEGKKRMAFADNGIADLANHVDSLITIPNDKLLKVLGRGVSLLDAFSAANSVLKGAVQGIAELITRSGLINVDFADVRTVMSEMGYAMMGSGSASGENRAEEAAEMAISSPLLEDIDLSGARGVLVNVCAGMDLRLDEFETVGNTIKAFASDNATVVIGTSLDPDMTDEIRVTVVATGVGMERLERNRNNNDMRMSSPQTMQNRPYHQSESRYNVHSQPMSTPLHHQDSRSGMHSSQQNAGDMSSKQVSKDDYLDIPAFLRKQVD